MTNEKSKRVAFLGVQRKNKKRILKNVVNYLKSDFYMFAPLITSASKLNSASATGLDIKQQPIKGKNRRLLKRVVDYLKSDSYMYASLFLPQPISSPSKGAIRCVKRVTMEISTRTLTTEENRPAAQLANVIVEDQLLEGILPEAGIINTSTSSHREVVKNVVHANCRSSSVPGNGALDSRIRKLLID